MEKWIFVNNITSIDKLYLLTKTISENEITEENHAVNLMNALNQNGANRTEANNHPINYVLFYNMVYFDGKTYKPTENGVYLINNYTNLINDKKLCAEFFFNVLLEIKYPNDAVNTSSKYSLHPFKILFKILYDERLDKKITSDEISKYISWIEKESDYDQFVNLLRNHRINNTPMPQCEEAAQIPTVVAGWINSFNVMKKEGNYIMISDELNLKLPSVNISSEIQTLPLSNKFISYVLNKHLFDGLSRTDIDASFYGTKKYNGMMSQLVVEYYGINNDKGIYNGIKPDIVDKFLRLQSDPKFIKLADALTSENAEEKLSHLDIFRKFYVSNSETKDSEEERLIALEEQFLNEYPLEKILDFSIDDYKNYCYKLEYDKTTYKHIGFPVGAGGSQKYGIYQKKDDKKFRDGNNEIIDDEKVEEYFNTFKTQLYSYLKEVGNSNGWIDPRNKYNLLAKTNYSNVWLQKLICCYFPDKVINVYDKSKLIEVAEYLNIPINYNCYPGEISFNINKWFIENMPEVKNYHPFYIGNAIYKFFDMNPTEDEQTEVNTDFITGGYNMIYYGTPGCGKSHTVNKKYNDSNGFMDNFVHRVTFHPEYSNSDFVGQILPKTENKQVKYDFQAGPFSIALKDALNNPDKKVCLIIEEINRGNASAIFGDIFQLLDRDDNGTSIYKIDNEPIKKYLVDNKINIEKIFIPSNLWIVATMNTSDQNVFTLDTAFKRRWRMRRIPNKFNMNDEYDKKLSKMYIPGSSYTWEQFIDSINTAILKNNPTGLNSEDKQLGVYFVTENELSFEPLNQDKGSIDKFIEKVLLYIWDDVAKIDPTLWFDDINSFDELVDEYYDMNLRVFRELFKDQQLNESQDNNEEN